MPTVRSNGIDLYYEEHGSGEPLLLIMGWGGNAATWKPQVPGLAERTYQLPRDHEMPAFGEGRARRRYQDGRHYSYVGTSRTKTPRKRASRPPLANIGMNPVSLSIEIR